MMGCQSSVVLGNNLTFTITTHDPDTGVLTDADAVPAYRVYEDETAAAILNGNMAKLDDANTTGFYSELIACTTGNGFEVGKSYNIYIAATVDGDEGGISYGFTVSGTGLTSLATGTAQAGAAGTITLAAGASVTDDLFNGTRIALIGGTGVGQSRIITDYDGGTKVADVAPNWTTNPDATTDYEIQASDSAVGWWRGTQVNALASGRVDADMGAISGDSTAADNLESYSDGTTPQPVNATEISGDSTAADNLELMYDGTGLAAVENAIADAWYKRDWTAIAGEAARSGLNALRFLRNKWSIAAGTLTVTEEDDTTAAWTAVITDDAAADNIVSVDPA